MTGDTAHLSADEIGKIHGEDLRRIIDDAITRHAKGMSRKELEDYYSEDVGRWLYSTCNEEVAEYLETTPAATPAAKAGGTPKHLHCRNCDYIDISRAFIGLHHCEDLGLRLDPGSTVPHGECPKCGAFAYPKP